ncbi:MAG TPA: hypothetical protein VEG30_14275 [Terriglobales bacterium]|nr:hypothetical protein [Terriglobales bacterium]
MPDPAEQLQRLFLAGFEFQTFDRFPDTVGALKGGCIALLRPTPEGLQIVGTPGWRMGEVMGVLVEREGKQVFQYKNEIVEATAEKVEELRRFADELRETLAA